MRVFKLRVQFFGTHHVKVHHIANVQVEDPVLRVLYTESVADIQFESLVRHDVEKFFFLLEAYAKLFALVFELCTVLTHQL
jgi:hypothetical protein